MELELLTRAQHSFVIGNSDITNLSAFLRCFLTYGRKVHATFSSLSMLAARLKLGCIESSVSFEALH